MTEKVLSDAEQEDIWQEQLEAQWQRQYEHKCPFGSEDDKDDDWEYHQYLDDQYNAKQRRIWSGNKIDIHEAYSELYRVSNHLLCYIAGDIIDKSITIFKSWDKETILSSETGHKLLAEINKIDLDRSNTIILSESSHNENIRNIKIIFNDIIVNDPCFSQSEQKYFTYDNAYEELYRVILIMIRSLMSDVLDYKIIWTKYEHHYKKVRYLSRKRARKIIKKCDKLICRDIFAPDTYIHQDKHLDFFRKIFKKIRTCPKDCFRFYPQNDKRGIDFERWLYD